MCLLAGLFSGLGNILIKVCLQIIAIDHFDKVSKDQMSDQTLKALILTVLITIVTILQFLNLAKLT